MAQKNVNSGNTMKVLITIVLVLAVALLYWFFYLDPSLDRIKGMQEEKSALGEHVNALEDKLRQQPALEDELANLQEEGMDLEILFPSVADLPEVLGNLEEMLNLAPVTVETFRTGDIRNEQEYSFLEFNLNLSGTEGRLLSLLEDLEDFMHLIMVDRILWQRRDDGSHLSMTYKMILLPEGQGASVGPETN